MRTGFRLGFLSCPDALRRHTSEQAHFTKADLTRAVLIATALKQVEETLGHEGFIALGDAGRRFTTKRCITTSNERRWKRPSD